MCILVGEYVGEKGPMCGNGLFFVVQNDWISFYCVLLLCYYNNTYKLRSTYVQCTWVVPSLLAWLDPIGPALERETIL